MIDIILFTTSYLLFGIALRATIRLIEPSENLLGWWLATIFMVVAWPLIAFLIVRSFWRHRRDR